MESQFGGAKPLSKQTPAKDTVPSKNIVRFVIAFGLVMLACGVVFAGYSMYVEQVYPQYHLVHHGFSPSVKVHRGITPYLWMPLMVLGAFISLCGFIEYFKYFRWVNEGTIVTSYEDWGIFTNSYYLVIEGETRAGSIRTERHRVGIKTYLNKEVGDSIRFN